MPHFYVYWTSLSFHYSCSPVLTLTLTYYEILRLIIWFTNCEVTCYLFWIIFMLATTFLYNDTVFCNDTTFPFILMIDCISNSFLCIFAEVYLSNYMFPRHNWLGILDIILIFIAISFVSIYYFYCYVWDL